MPLITDAQIAYMRAAQQELMPDLATIEVMATAADGYGGQSRTWAAIPGTVPCRVMPTPPAPREAAGQLSPDLSVILTLPAGTDVGIGDRVVVEGVRYEIRSAPAGGSMETARQFGADPL